MDEWTSSLTAILGDKSARHRCTDLLNELFFDLVVLAEPDVFIEAGAHEAAASIRVKHLRPACRAIAFEANPFVYDRMSRNHDYPAHGVEYRHQALSDGPAEVSFQVVAAAVGLSDPRHDGLSSLNRRHNEQAHEIAYDTVTVPATTLDAACAEGLPRSAALWVDVEGAAKQVLRGGGEFLGRCDVIKIEVEDYAFWQEQWLVADVLTELHRHGLQPLARDVEHDYQYNMVLVSPRLTAHPAFAPRFATFRDDLAALSSPG